MLILRKMILFAVLNMWLSVPSNMAAQERLSNQTGCDLIDKSRAAQFISYDGVSEATSEVRLHLHNNTTCSIIVETDDRNLVQVGNAKNSGLRGEDAISNSNPVRLPLHYLIQDRQNWKVPEPAYGWGDSVFTYELLAGQSAAFTVPLIHFKKRMNVAVPFNYGWESNKSIGTGVGGVIHRVYFLVDDLPEAILGRRR